MDMSLSKLLGLVMDREAWGCKELDTTERLNQTIVNGIMQCSKNLNSFLFQKSELLVVNPGCLLESPGKPVKPNNQATPDTDAVKLFGSGWGPGSRGFKAPL